MDLSHRSAQPGRATGARVQQASIEIQLFPEELLKDEVHPPSKFEVAIAPVGHDDDHVIMVIVSEDTHGTPVGHLVGGLASLGVGALSGGGQLLHDGFLQPLVGLGIDAGQLHREAGLGADPPGGGNTEDGSVLHVALPGAGG